MKVLQILYSGLGGHGNVAFSLIEGDKNSSWDNSLIFFGIEPLLGSYKDYCKKQAIKHNYVPVVEGKPWLSWLRLWQGLKCLKPEAIVLHSIKTILPCWLYSRLYAIPLIAVEHQPNILKKKSEWIVSKLAMLLADQIVLLTPEYQQDLSVELGGFYKQHKTTIIPNGLDTARFSPSITSKKSQNITLGMAARFTNKKRQDTLTGMMSYLNNSYSHFNWKLSLAGDGEELQKVKELALNASLLDLIEFPGYLDEPSLVEWFNTIDIYIHASDGETLSTSLLQAMAMQLPIIGSDVPGISNLLVSDEKFGVLVDSHSECFAHAVYDLVSNPDKAKELAKAARAKAEQVYSHEVMFARYNDLLSR